MLIFLLGAAILIGTLVVGGMRLAASTVFKRKHPTKNTAAIFAAILGLFLGGFVGAQIGFGRVMISIFNPDLPEQDFSALFGAVGGGLLGAFFFALLSGTLQSLVVRPNNATQPEDCRESLPNSHGDTTET